MTAITGIATMGVPVRSQDGALGFYRDKHAVRGGAELT